MRTINFVTYVHGPTSEEYDTVEILGRSDVNKLIAKQMASFAKEIDRLVCDNRKLREENRRLQRICKRLEDGFSALTTEGQSLEDCFAQVEELRRRLDRLPTDCAGLFASVIGETMSPKLDLFAHQIGVVLPTAETANRSEKKVAPRRLVGKKTAGRKGSSCK